MARGRRNNDSKLGLIIIFFVIQFVLYRVFFAKRPDPKKIVNQPKKKQRVIQPKKQVTKAPKAKPADTKTKVIIDDKTGDVSFQLSKDKLVELYVKVLEAKKRAEIVYNYQLWRNAAVRFRKDRKLKKADLHAKFQINALNKRKEAWNRHLNSRLDLVRDIANDCDKAPKLESAVESYKEFVKGELQ